MKIEVLHDWCEADTHPRVGVADDVGFKPNLCVRVAGVSLCAYCLNWAFVQARTAEHERRGVEVTSTRFHLFAFEPEIGHVEELEEMVIDGFAADLFQAFCFANNRKLDREWASRSIQAIRAAEELVRDLP